MKNSGSYIYQIAPCRPVSVNVNVGAVGSQDGEFGRRGWRFMVLGKLVYQTSHQPGSPAGGNLPLQVSEGGSLAVKNI
jgi:hypothetical protein